MTDTHTPPADLDTTGRHPATERWLDDLHVPWRFDPAVPLDRIDQAGGLVNQARLEPLDPDVVERYAADLRRGDEFPPILLEDRGKRKALPLGGNHRLAAHHGVKRPTIAAYVVTVEPEQARRLIYEDNRRHGLPPSRAERLTQAVHLVENGWTVRDAAACVGVDEPAVSTKRGVVRTGRRATDLNLDRAFHTLPESTRYQLGQIPSDPVFTEAAKLTLAAQLPAAEVTKLRKRLADARSEADQLAIIGTELEERADDIAASAGGKVKRQATARTKLTAACSQIRWLSPAEVRNSCATAEVRRDLNGRIGDTIEALQAISKALR